MSRTIADYAIGKAILDGTHDEEFHIIEAAVAHRRKMLDRIVNAMPGCRFVANAMASKSAGREGTILKVNPKRYVIHFDGDDFTTAYAIPKAAVTVTPLANRAERIANLDKIDHDAQGEWILRLPVYDAATGEHVADAAPLRS